MHLWFCKTIPLLYANWPFISSAKQPSSWPTISGSTCLSPRHYISKKPTYRLWGLRLDTEVSNHVPLLKLQLVFKTWLLHVDNSAHRTTGRNTRILSCTGLWIAVKRVGWNDSRSWYSKLKMLTLFVSIGGSQGKVFDIGFSHETHCRTYF